MELAVNSPVTPDQMKLSSAHGFSLDDPCIPSFLPSGTLDHTSALHLGAIFNIKSTSEKHNSVTDVAWKGHFFTVSELKLAKNVALTSSRSNSSFLLVCACVCP